MQPQSIRETNLLDREVLLDESQLVAQRYLVALLTLQHLSQHCA